LFKISELANEFSISTRTIRYYEELHLLTPARTDGNQRMYSKGDHVKLQLILRGKRYGFTLEEIKEMVQLFEVDPSGVKQLERTITLGEKRLNEITIRINELTQLKNEMENLLLEFRERVKRGEKHELL
jgi:DNA-binding transcriptional MerR regulator